MANLTTMLADLINPEVMADMISAKVEEKIIVTPFAAVDTTLQGRAGDSVTVPQYAYIGDAEDIAEGVAVGTVKLETSIVLSEYIAVPAGYKSTNFPSL